jgi:RNA polymerase sigma-70 factor (ECF subfamily)
MGVMEEIERDLVRRARDGDQEAFRCLVERHHEQVYRTAYAVLADAAGASEVEQDAWVNAWRGLDRFRGEASFVTWVTRLTLNAASDYLRRHARRPTEVRLDGFDVAERPAAWRVEERDEIDRAMRALGRDARDVVALRYGLDMTVPQIAAALGCPQGTIKSRLHGALAQLRRALQTGRDTEGAA